MTQTFHENLIGRCIYGADTQISVNIKGGFFLHYTTPISKDWWMGVGFGEYAPKRDENDNNVKDKKTEKWVEKKLKGSLYMDAASVCDWTHQNKGPLVFHKGC